MRRGQKNQSVEMTRKWKEREFIESSFNARGIQKLKESLQVVRYMRELNYIKKLGVLRRDENYVRDSFICAKGCPCCDRGDSCSPLEQHLRILDFFHSLNGTELSAQSSSNTLPAVLLGVQTRN